MADMTPVNKEIRPEGTVIVESTGPPPSTPINVADGKGASTSQQINIEESIKLTNDIMAAQHALTAPAVMAYGTPTYQVLSIPGYGLVPAFGSYPATPISPTATRSGEALRAATYPVGMQAPTLADLERMKREVQMANSAAASYPLYLHSALELRKHAALGYPRGGMPVHGAGALEGVAPFIHYAPATPPSTVSATPNANDLSLLAQVSARRNGWSPTSGSDHSPVTPQTAQFPYLNYHTGIGSIDNSPALVHNAAIQNELNKLPNLASLSLNRHNDGDMTLDLSWHSKLSNPAFPIIPPAVPAVFTDPGHRRALSVSLYNPTRTTNVYIRGLTPDTDDDKLHSYVARFGLVLCHKSILDLDTGTCKGCVIHPLGSSMVALLTENRFGFALYEARSNAEDCIKGFHHLGYEVSFAKESFNSRMKALADPGNTNLYISNLPRDITELQLEALFLPTEVVSSKILRDNLGNNRGVGFAKFEDRRTCDDIIRRLNNAPVGHRENNLVQIRYADSTQQKEFKHITAQQRQYRTLEYNAGARAMYTAAGLTPPRSALGNITNLQFRSIDSWRANAGPNMGASTPINVKGYPAKNVDIPTYTSRTPAEHVEGLTRAVNPTVEATV